MGDDADEAAAFLEVHESFYGEVEGFGVESAEAFVDEDGVEADAAGVVGDDVGEAKRKGEGGEEGFAAREGRHRACVARVLIKDFEVKSRAPAHVGDAFFALQAVLPVRHAQEAHVRGVRHVGENGA